MKTIKRIIARFKKLRTKDKIMAASALVMTLAVLVAVPTMAWFAHQRKLSTMAKINAPSKISLRSGAGEDIIQFKMSGIDTEKGSPKYYVFCVDGEDINYYNIQLAHTTNIDFDYKIYKATSSNDTSDIEYEKEDGTKTYYKKDANAIEGSYINQSSISFTDGETTKTRKVGSDSYVEPSYESSDSRQDFAEPLYWQTDPDNPILANDTNYDEYSSDEHSFRNYYILEVSWSDVKNDKETDLIYLTAQVASAPT